MSSEAITGCSSGRSSFTDMRLRVVEAPTVQYAPFWDASSGPSSGSSNRGAPKNDAVKRVEEDDVPGSVLGFPLPESDTSSIGQWDDASTEAEECSPLSESGVGESPASKLGTTGLFDMSSGDGDVSRIASSFACGQQMATCVEGGPELQCERCPWHEPNSPASAGDTPGAPRTDVVTCAEEESPFGFPQPEADIVVIDLFVWRVQSDDETSTEAEESSPGSRSDFSEVPESDVETIGLFDPDGSHVTQDVSLGSMFGFVDLPENSEDDIDTAGLFDTHDSMHRRC